MADSKNARPPLSDADLESLLKRRRLSDPRRERVLARVLASVDQAPASVRPRRWRAWSASVGLAGGLVAVVIALGLRGRSVDDGWRSRGEASHGGASSLSLDVGCTGGTPDRCPAGSILIVRVQGATAGRYLSAYAEPVTPGGERIWYFSGLALPPPGPQESPIVLKQGVRVGPEHSAVAYDVHLIATRKPFSQVDIAAMPRSEILAERVQRLMVIP